MEPEISYTVKQPAKLTCLRERPHDPRPSVWLPIIKWIFALLLFVSVLACVVASKISLISIGMYYNTSRLPEGVHFHDSSSEKETIFIFMVLTLMIPQGFSFLRACWVSLFRSSHPWPSNVAIFWCSASSIFEVAGLCYFTVVIVVHSTLTAPYCIFIMNGVFLVPIAWHMWKRRSSVRENWKQYSALVLSLFLEIISIVLLTININNVENSKTPAIAIPVSLFLLSLAWCPKVQKLMLLPRGFEYEEEPNTREASMTTAAGGSTNGTNDNPVINSDETARGKATIITGLLKLLVTPFMAALFCYVYEVADLNKLNAGFSSLTTSHSAFPHFMAQIFTSAGGYLLGWLACSMCLQEMAFALPLTLATPVAMLLMYIPNICATDAVPFHCVIPNQDQFVIPLAVCLWLAQFLSTGYYVWKGQTFIMAKESSLFWFPNYNGVFLEQNLLLNRKNEITDEYQVNQREIAKNSCVYICTTMYHETENEMEQLLHSLHDVDTARAASRRQFESHIFFDGAVKGDVLNDFVLQLIALIPKTLKVKIESCMKIKTPYGMQMRWRLPGGMPFHIHLKDNLKVKNKKRWSQAMYMSYVLDYKEETMGVTDDNTYILATDADVKFTHESVQALLDLMMRDARVGAVCGRTHPLGVGPIVWYQVFDYAIGHWFQKVANHVLGSVLCSPGCFSVYRAKAVRDVLPIYATGVTTSTDFLTKDMGEDRWFCTLMVQSGWRLEYCAAAEDSTFCPDTFDEFFRQRRRWIPSTLANLLQLISEWKETVENNDVISFFFIMYQGLNVFSTLICPATVILVISGALRYVDIGVSDPVVPAVLLTLLTIGFTFVCLYTKQDFQLKVAKLLTVAFALLMAFVTIGMAAQVAIDLKKRNTPPTTPTPTPFTNVTAALYTGSTPTTPYGDIADHLPADVSSLYLGGLIGIFFLAALLHPFEGYCLIHGFWYLLCLPSGYLLLIIYSVCNMTDRSWGTRETKERKTADDVPWYKELWNTIKYIFTCCRPQPIPDSQASAKGQSDSPNSHEEVSSMSDSTFSDDDLSTSEPAVEDSKSSSPDDLYLEEEGGEGAVAPAPIRAPLSEPPKSALKSKLRRTTSHDDDAAFRPPKWRFPGEKKVRFDAKLPKFYAETPVEDWLPIDLKRLYLNNFKAHGYDNVSFIAGMTNKDLRSIGISTRGHRMQLVYLIDGIPHVQLNADVPENVEEWLHDLGLESYWDYFVHNGYNEPRVLEDLKAMDNEMLRQTLREDLQISKPGHLAKMIKAIKKLQYPTPSEREIRRARETLKEAGPVTDLEAVNQDEGKEFRFWKGLREACLMPESAVFGVVTELKEKLEDLRDSTLMVFAIVNAIWMILIITLTKLPELMVFGTNALGFAFLAIYGLIIIIQFLTLIWHRLSTWCHLIARAPWKRGPYKMSWSFSDANLPPEPTQAELDKIRRHRGRRTRRRSTGRRHSSSSDVTQPLLGDMSTDYSGASYTHATPTQNSHVV